MFVTVTAIASTAAMSVYISHTLAGRLTEQRSLALSAAMQTIDDMRGHVATQSLETVFAEYGPLPPAAPLVWRARFDVLNLPRFQDRSVGTVTIINDETPNEADFGYNYSSPLLPPPVFGVDINGNGRLLDSNPAPFPLDINEDGDTSDNVVINGFRVLPVVVTVQWLTPQGLQRVDVFAVLAKEKYE
jgi:hypothetical protein